MLKISKPILTGVAKMPKRKLKAVKAEIKQKQERNDKLRDVASALKHQGGRLTRQTSKALADLDMRVEEVLSSASKEDANLIESLAKAEVENFAATALPRTHSATPSTLPQGKTRTVLVKPSTIPVDPPTPVDHQKRLTPQKKVRDRKCPTCPRTYNHDVNFVGPYGQKVIPLSVCSDSWNIMFT